MQAHSRSTGCLVLLCLLHGLLPGPAWPQSPAPGQVIRPNRSDSSGLLIDWGTFSNEEALDLPEKPQYLTSDPIDERMMQLDDAISAQTAFNLCSLSWEELVGSGLLSALQASAWLTFRKIYGCPTAWYELQAVVGFDTTLIRKLRTQTSLESSSTFHTLGYSLSHGRATLMLRSTRNLSGLRGYEAGGGSNAGLSAYRGGPQAHLWQLRHTGYRHRLVLSLPKTQGAYGMGSLGGGLMLTSDPGRRRTASIALGDYHLRLGLGLSWNTGMTGSLTSGIMGMRWLGQSMGVASGTASSVNLRGITVEQGIGRSTRLLSWMSLQRPDARIVYGADSLEALISSLPTGTLARTQSEWQSRKSSTFQSSGLSVLHEYKNVIVMIYSSMYQYNYGFLPANTAWPSAHVPPRQSALTGLSFLKSGRGWELSGECALHGLNGFSTLQQLILTPHSRWQTAWIGRHYFRGHAPPFAGALGRQSSPVNEQGFTWMIQWLGHGRSRLLGLADSYRHPLPRFGIPLPSYGYRLHLQAECWLNKEHLFHGRIDMRKEWGGQNQGFALPSSSFEAQNAWALGWNHQSRQHPIRECRIRLDGRMNAAEQQATHLHSLALSARIRWVVGAWRISVQHAWVNTQEGTGPFYFFEPAPRFASGMSAVSGRAIRQVGLAEYRLSKDLSAWIRLDRTRYFDREHAGSGWETTSGPFRASCTLQLLYKLAGPRSFTPEKIAHWHENPLPEPNDVFPVNPK